MKGRLGPMASAEVEKEIGRLVGLANKAIAAGYTAPFVLAALETNLIKLWRWSAIVATGALVSDAVTPVASVEDPGPKRG